MQDQDQKRIPGGATVWARQTIDSDIFRDKPDKWFKMWFFIVSRVNHKDNGKFKRGSCFLFPRHIAEATGATEDQVKKFLKWARGNDMLLTKRSTRGIHLTVNKYNVFQDFSSYSGTRKALEKHQRSTTINNNGKNDKKYIYGEFENVKLSDTEKKKLTDIYGNISINSLIEELSAYIPNKPGTPYKSHYHTLRNWARKKGMTPLKKTKQVEDVELTPEMKKKNAELMKEIRNSLPGKKF